MESGGLWAPLPGIFWAWTERVPIAVVAPVVAGGDEFERGFMLEEAPWDWLRPPEPDIFYLRFSMKSDCPKSLLLSFVEWPELGYSIELF